MKKINLGDKVKDPISGVIGIVVARTEWLHGCARITVQPKGVSKEGEPFKNSNFDEPQLELMEPKKVKRGSTKKGGPRQAPETRQVISRYND